MAKRRQTTGRPRKDHSSKLDAAGNPTFWDNLLGNPSSRTEREDAVNRLLQRSVMVFVILIGVILAAALIYETLVVPQLTVATVNGDRITVNEFRERVTFEQAWVLQQAQVRYSQVSQQAAAFGMDANELLQQDQQFQQWSRELQLPDLIGERVVNDMIDDALIRQEFEARGLSIGEAEIDSVRQDFFGVDMTEIALIGTPATETPIPTITNTPFVSPTPSLTPTLTLTPTITPSPTLDPEATAEVTAEVTAELTALATIPPSPTASQEDRIQNFNESVDLFSESLKSANVSRAAIDDFWERQARQNALVDAIIGPLEMTTFANVRHILVETEDEANEIIAALNTGESFALLASSRSLDTGSGSQGGELDWQPIDIYVPAFADAVRDAELGTIVGPVESDFGFHIIQVRAREERVIEGQPRDQVRLGIFSRWLEAQLQAAEDAGNITINDNWPDYLPSQQAQPQQQ
jgi:parvulin-like peptidyl-prolyl isomerase